MVMASSGRTVVGLPTLTEAALHTKYTNRLTCVDAYQTLPDLLPVLQKHLVFLVWSTRAYQPPDLALALPCETFTNDYHRGQETHN